MWFSGKPHSHKTLNAAIRDVNPIYLERREPARNRQRFYAILITPTLFGAWAMVREWGRIGHPGTVRETWFATETAAIQAGAAMRQRKERRGHHAVGG